MLKEWPTQWREALPAHLCAQRWYAGSDRPSDVQLVKAERLWDDGNARELWHLLVDADGATYQLLAGVRPSGEPAEFLHGHEASLIGSVGDAFAYDAVWDSEMAKALLQVVSGGSESAKRARAMAAEQSNTSIVYDDRLILKLFRRLRPGRNLDMEVTTALASSGFAHVAQPLVEWRDDTYDYAFGQQFLAGGTEGWALALTSLRDLYTDGASDSPAEAGGDFAAEARRLGKVTAEMHVALNAVFGSAVGDDALSGWRRLVDSLPERLRRAGDRAGHDLATPGRRMIAHLREVADPGPAVRVHGDYHLGQVMRTDLGWYVLDFEGEPAREVEERLVPASPFKDVTGMLRSFHYASRHALVERAVADWADMVPAARAWESHNRQAFLDGYMAQPGIADLLPDPAASAAVMIGYELDKALYELEYELAYRPEWVSIPLDALERLVEGGADV